MTVSGIRPPSIPTVTTGEKDAAQAGVAVGGRGAVSTAAGVVSKVVGAINSGVDTATDVANNVGTASDAYDTAEGVKDGVSAVANAVNRGGNAVSETAEVLEAGKSAESLSGLARTLEGGGKVLGAVGLIGSGLSAYQDLKDPNMTTAEKVGSIGSNAIMTGVAFVPVAGPIITGGNLLTGGAVGGGLEAFIDWASGDQKALDDFTQKALNGDKGTLLQALGQGKGLGEALEMQGKADVKWVGDAATTAGKWIGKEASAAGSWVKDEVSSGLGKAKSFASDELKKAESAVASVVPQGVKDVAGKVESAVAGAVQGKIDEVKSDVKAVATVAADVKNEVSSVATAVSGKVSNAWHSLTSLF
jgi:hypothetical protein